MPISVCHVAMGDLWAGAEVQLRVLLSRLVRETDFRLSVILLNPGRLEREIAGMGIPVAVLPEGQWGSAKIFRELIRRFQASPPQIVHTHKYKDTILAAPAARWCGVPVVIRTVHGLSEPFMGAQALRMNAYEWLERQVHARMVDTIIGVSKQIEDRVRAGKQGRHVTCIHNGIELEERTAADDCRAAKRRELGLTDDICAIGAVGRLTAVKGLETLLLAARHLLDENQKVRVVLIGDGPLRETLEARAVELGIRQNLALLGHREDTDELMQAVDIYALPSLSEGIPMALLEAMAAGKPVAASRVGGIPEVVEDGVSGFLVEPSNPAEWAVKCRQLIRNPHMAQKMGLAARTRVEQEFSAAKMTERVSALYRQSVTRPEPF